MSTLGSFATEQTGYLRARLGLESDEDLARTNIVKLAEETGEVAGAYLSLMGHQRAEKLTGTVEARRAALGRELADVVATAVILLHTIGLDVDDTITQRLRELEHRRVAWAGSQST